MDSVLKVAGGAVISAVVMGVAWWSSTQTEKQNEDLNPDAKKDKVAILQTELLRMRKEVEDLHRKLEAEEVRTMSFQERIDKQKQEYQVQIEHLNNTIKALESSIQENT